MESLRISFESQNAFPLQAGLITDFAQAGIQSLFPCVPKRRMSQIMCQSCGFRQFRSQAVVEKRLLYQQVVSYCSGNLGYLDTVGQACAVEVRLPYTEDLGFSLKAAECSTMQDSVPIPFRVFGATVPFLLPAQCSWT